VTWRRAGGFFILRLVRGEDIPTEVAGFVRRLKVRSGIVSGIGAASDIELGYFHLHSRRYARKRIKAECEVASIAGNIAWAEHEPVCHLHAVVTDSRMRAWGGHLFAARVAATCEVCITPGRARLARVVDPETGLKLLHLAAAMPARRRGRSA
jgi:hypothetical protein